jgi:CRP-like cAMP-binding protein
MKEFCIDEFMTKILNSPTLKGHEYAKKYKKGSFIFNQGEICRDVFCLQRGLIKIYYNTLDGKERIKVFIADRGIFGSRSSQALNIPSPFSTLCLEDTEIIRFPYDLFEDACFEDLQLARSVFRFTQWLAVKKELREYQLLCLSVEDAYQEFILANPNLLARLTQIDIARYLGITPIALSRIKKRLA